MKRLHVHVHVEDLAASIRFYASLFGTPPNLLHDDYAKWSLEDPAVNFAISERGGAAGLDHLGIQVDNTEALAAITGRLAAAGMKPVEQADTTCCYAHSDKTWVNDPQGIAWETFVTHKEIATTSTEGGAASCCGNTTCGAPAETATACCV